VRVSETYLTLNCSQTRIGKTRLISLLSARSAFTPIRVIGLRHELVTSCFLISPFDDINIIISDKWHPRAFRGKDRRGTMMADAPDLSMRGRAAVENLEAAAEVTSS
jgi:hypothetical protein